MTRTIAVDSTPPISLLTDVPLSPGDIVMGKYRIGQRLGKGGMAVVLEGMHLELRQRVALKVLLPQTAAVAEASKRFLHEARVAVKLKSNNVARVLDVGTLPEGLPFMVMDFLEGEDLNRVLVREKKLPVGVAVDYIMQACDAVAEAHTHAIIHCDLKPANLFLTARRDGSPQVKVLDFGISKGLRGGTGATAEAVVGSPQYMSPEQLTDGDKVDERTDVWGLGVVLYEFLTGTSPFAGGGKLPVHEILKNIMKAPPAPLPAEVPSALVKVIDRCLEKNPAARFANIGELATALEPFSTPRPKSVAPPWGRRSRSKNRWLPLVALAVPVVALGGAAWVIATRPVLHPVPAAKESAVQVSPSIVPSASPPEAAISVAPVASTSASARPRVDAPARPVAPRPAAAPAKSSRHERTDW
jgi:serine/threonine-protein kinase